MMRNVLIINNRSKNLDKNVPPNLASWVNGFLVSTARTFPGILPDSPGKHRNKYSVFNSMDKPGIEVCRSRLDLHTSTLDLCRSRLDVCRSKVMHINLRYLALRHCQKFRNLFLKQNVKFFFLNSVYKLPKLTILNISMFQLGPM